MRKNLVFYVSGISMDWLFSKGYGNGFYLSWENTKPRIQVPSLAISISKYFPFLNIIQFVLFCEPHEGSICALFIFPPKFPVYSRHSTNAHWPKWHSHGVLLSIWGTSLWLHFVFLCDRCLILPSLWHLS